MDGVTTGLLTGVRILMVDDDPRVLATMADQLRFAGATVTGATSADEGFAALDRGAFDVIVSDMAMPGTSGPQLLQRLRERPATQGGLLPVIAVSGFPLDGRASVAGFTTILQKPIEMQTLIDAVASVLSRKPGTR